jgi:hypothetical protein
MLVLHENYSLGLVETQVNIHSTPTRSKSGNTINFAKKYPNADSRIRHTVASGSASWQTLSLFAIACVRFCSIYAAVIVSTNLLAAPGVSNSVHGDRFGVHPVLQPGQSSKEPCSSRFSKSVRFGFLSAAVTGKIVASFHARSRARILGSII